MANYYFCTVFKALNLDISSYFFFGVKEFLAKLLVFFVLLVFFNGVYFLGVYFAVC